MIVRVAAMLMLYLFSLGSCMTCIFFGIDPETYMCIYVPWKHLLYKVATLEWIIRGFINFNVISTNMVQLEIISVSINLIFQDRDIVSITDIPSFCQD